MNISYTNGVTVCKACILYNHMVGQTASGVSPFYYLPRGGGVHIYSEVKTSKISKFFVKRSWKKIN